VRIVIDASVAVKWVLDEPNIDAAAALREDELIAPAFWLLEAASVLWRRSIKGEFDADEACELLSELLNAPVASLPIGAYLNSALRLAIDLGHPVYDCLYLAVAIQHQTHVVTADRRFAAIGARPEMAGRVRLLGS
jgi:predicted nucleic acid-binding protein